jgi:pyrroline-5-carboxylate reductase
VQPKHILITKRNIQTLNGLERRGVLVSDKNEEAVRYADLVILAVKPFQVNEILRSLKDQFEDRHVLVSVVTGVSIENIAASLGRKVPIVRAMPNTAIAIQESMTCLAAQNVNEEQLQYVHELFGQLGKAVRIDEKLMDAATVLGACGTAFAMRYIRANEMEHQGFSSSLIKGLVASYDKIAKD